MKKSRNILRNLIRAAAVCIFSLLVLRSEGQQEMFDVGKLIVNPDSAWQSISQAVLSAHNKVEVLAPNADSARSVIYKSQITTRSALGSLIYNTGGVLIDNGWIRILGSGSPRLSRNIADWNKGKTFKQFGEQPAYLLIADDAAGGFFAINRGALGKDLNKVYYLSPDDLEWGSLDLSYREFLFFCFNNDLDKFYKGMRWSDWKNEAKTLSSDEAYHFTPPLWSREGKDVNKDMKMPVPVGEVYEYSLSLRKTLGLDKKDQQ